MVPAHLNHSDLFKFELLRNGGVAKVHIWMSVTNKVELFLIFLVSQTNQDITISLLPKSSRAPTE